jgi:hypothetical protein
MSYLEEQRGVVVGALKNSFDLVRAGKSWETTLWTRSRPDADMLVAMMRESVFDVVAGEDSPVFACVGLAQRHDAESSQWGAFVAVRPVADD